MMLPVESGTLPHRPWTTMSIVNGRVPASEALREGWSEAEVCAEEVAAPRNPMWHLRDEQPAEPSASRCASCRTSTIGKQLHSAKQSTIGRSNLPNQQHLDEQPAELAASGRATYRTSSIGKSTFCQIMVPKGQVLRG